MGPALRSERLPGGPAEAGPAPGWWEPGRRHGAGLHMRPGERGSWQPALRLISFICKVFRKFLPQEHADPPEGGWLCGSLV